MTNNLENETMYCSDSEYDSDSEQTQWEEASDDEFGIYDGEAANLDYESRTAVPETTSNHWYKHKQTMRVPMPVQLAAMTSDYETIEEAREALWQKMMQDEHDAREARFKAFEEELVQNEINLVAHYKYQATLPTESVDGKIKRLAKEKLDAEERVKAKMKKFKEGKKALPFGHRRNGGGKHSNHEPTSKEVIAARRALHRAETKRVKKQEEELRATKFAHEGVKEVVQEEYIMMPKSKKSEEEDNQEREEMAAARAKTMKTLTNLEDLVVVKSNKTKKKKVVEPMEDEWTKVKTKKTMALEPLVLKMGAAPYKPSWQTRTTTTTTTTTTTKPQQLERTRMCRSVDMGKPCPHGDKCRFAHTTEELNVGPCSFGSSCRLVCCSENKYFNKKTVSKICQYIHPEETKDEYLHRAGIKTTVTVAVPNKKITPAPSPVKPAWTKPVVTEVKDVKPAWTKPVVTEVKDVKPAWTKPVVTEVKAVEKPMEKPAWTKIQSSISSNSSTTTGKRLCSSVGTGKPCRHGAKCRFSHEKVEDENNNKETVITVPAHMAMQALEMAMAKGMTNVRVEISD